MFRPFVSSPHWTYSTFPQRFLLIQLKPKHVFRRGARDVRSAVFRDTPILTAVVLTATVPTITVPTNSESR